MTDPRIVALDTEHTRALAECHIDCWREAYADLVPRHVLDAFDVDRRAAQWERTRARDPGDTWVALVEEVVVGFANTRVPRDDPPAADRELGALYVRSPWYGTGLADALLDRVLTPRLSHSLWVFAENPRARAFYRRRGFVADGARRIEDFSPAEMVRMVRAVPL
ncbi:GNAT family N-acetyltransferase [Nocardia takedensis]